VGVHQAASRLGDGEDQSDLRRAIIAIRDSGYYNPFLAIPGRRPEDFEAKGESRRNKYYSYMNDVLPLYKYTKI